jgi:tight adherence protein C
MGSNLVIVQSNLGSAELLLFAGLFLAAFSVFSLVRTFLASSQDKQVLSWLNDDSRNENLSPTFQFLRALMHQFALKYAIKFKNPTYRKNIEKLLMTSGVSRQMNVDEFIGFQLLYSLVLPLLFFILNFALQLDIPLLAFPIMVVGGYFLPLLDARAKKRAREISVRVDLPFFADLLALSTEAGLDFISSIQRIVDKAEKSVLADELSTVLKDIKLGSSRADALKAMAQRLDIPEITSFVAVLVDADATGASIAQVLKDQSNQIRLERFVRAEKAGARASQTILLPLMLFILPAVFIVVFGPVIMQFFYGGK